MTIQNPKLNKVISLEDGSGGEKSNELIKKIRSGFKPSSEWKNIEDDAAVFSFGHRLSKDEKLVFTTDAFIVDPIFFPGGDIGKIAMCGTINDLSVMGATPVGISLSLVIEEGFSESDLAKIVQSINKISQETNVPIVTGDTKVTEKGKLDKIEITTAGIGIAKKIIKNGGAKAGDLVISSGDLGEHTVALLSKRFNYKTKIKSDCRPLTKEIQSVLNFLTSCKDPTRGGMAAILNEIADKSKIYPVKSALKRGVCQGGQFNGVKIILYENKLPFKKEVVAVSELLGIDIFSLASEGHFLATVSKSNAQKAVEILRKFNKEAKIIGEVQKGRGVYLKTNLGSFRKIEVPRGKLIPRIC